MGVEPLWVERSRRLAIGAWAAIGVGVLLVMATWIINRIAGVLTPFILAAILVYVLRPVVNRIQALGVPRLASVVLTFLGASLIFVVALALIGPPLVGQAAELLRRMPEYWNSLVGTVRHWEGRMAGMPLGRSLLRWMEDVPARAQEFGGIALAFVNTQAGALGAFALSVFMAPVLAFFILLDLPATRNAITGLLPHGRRPEFLDLLEEVDKVLAGYLRGQLINSLVLGVMTFVLFETAAVLGYGVPYALALSVGAGALNVIPYFGPWAIALVAALVGLFQSPLHALVAFAAIMIAQQIESTFLAPKIMSDAVSLHPALIIFVLLVAGGQFGIMGMLLAIPAAAAAKAVGEHFYRKYVPAEAPGHPDAAADE